MELLISFGGLIIGYIFAMFWCKVTKSFTHFFRPRGYHLHHTFFIFPILLVAIFSFGITRTFFLFIGLGILAHHLITERNIKFVSKDSS